jgi:hypothetical protein
MVTCTSMCTLGCQASSSGNLTQKRLRPCGGAPERSGSRSLPGPRYRMKSSEIHIVFCLPLFGWRRNCKRMRCPWLVAMRLKPYLTGTRRAGNWELWSSTIEWGQIIFLSSSYILLRTLLQDFSSTGKKKRCVLAPSGGMRRRSSTTGIRQPFHYGNRGMPSSE